MNGYTDERGSETSADGAAQQLVFSLNFPWTTPPVHANKRNHWATIKSARTASSFMARAARMPELHLIRVDLTWVVKDHRRRDGGENLAPLSKPLIDGLVDAGVVADDDPKHVIRTSPTVRYEAGCTPHFTLTITQLDPMTEQVTGA